ncbi:MAG: tRNA1(Val) (adenine(37)-N6)-methyltransferase [Candidatus Limivicinus sp.]
MPEFTALWDKGPVFAQAEHFRMGTDSVLLADFVRLSGIRRGIDLGCASGAIALLLLCRSEHLHMTGLEIVEDAVALARENMARNGLAQRSRMLWGDIRRHRELFKSGSFDLVVANPPYFPVERGFLSPAAGRRDARGETQCSLEELCAAAAFLCRTGGSFCLVHKPERLSELLRAMSAYGLEPKRLRLVCHRADSAPSLVLVEGRRGGKPGLKVLPMLILRNDDGSETEEALRIYHKI